MYPNYNMYNQYYGFREYNYRNSEMKEESGKRRNYNIKSSN
jgi:hypothetical protein